MSRKTVAVLSVALVAGCAALQGPDPSNVAAYCTAENGYRVGSEARAYLGECPKDRESAFLAGLQRGRAIVPPTPQAQPYLAQMTETEKQLLAATSDPERERLKSRLRELEWWAIHLIHAPGSYGIF